MVCGVKGSREIKETVFMPLFCKLPNWDYGVDDTARHRCMQ